jgi:3'(2'), 5'-bisphosphate nucleotidase
MNDADLGEQLADIVEAASDVILPIWRTAHAVDTKADESPVTEADRRGEALILERLKAAFPDIPVIAEEAASADGVPLSIACRFFLVDPLDGTKAFVRGEDYFTVNIGLIDNGVPVAGAVASPATGETWYTTSGGARRRRFGEKAGEPIHVRKRKPGEVVALSSHTLKPEHAEALKAQYGYDQRVSMDSSVKLCMIADGRADLYPRHGTTMEWDVAAGHAVLVAAGGRFTTPEGGRFLYGKADQGFKNGWFVAQGD